MPAKFLDIRDQMLRVMRYKELTFVDVQEQRDDYTEGCEVIIVVQHNL